MSLPIIIGPQTTPARAFLDNVIALLQQRLARGAIARSSGPSVHRWAMSLWNDFSHAYPGPWFLAEDLQVYGLAPWLDHGLYLRWRTSRATRSFRLPPSPYEAHETIPLGTFSGFTLAVDFDGPVAPRLSAAQADRMLEWKLYQPGPMNEQNPKPLLEALRRANLVNSLAGTQWAKPNSAGSLGVPFTQEASG